MDQLTSSELFNQVYLLYRDEEYERAYDLLTDGASHFPKQSHKFYFWRTCLSARMNKIQQAAGLLEEAIQAGHWYSENQLREEPDFEALQGLPAFENLITICQKRQVAAQTQAVPELLTLVPNTSPPWPVLLALHGHNSNAEASYEHWNPITSLGWLLAVPQSSQIIGSNTYTWSDTDQAEKEIQGHYTALCEQYIIDQRQVVLGGFSLGGGLAVTMALKGAFKMRGFIAVAPYLPDVDRVIALLSEKGAVQGMRGYIIAGEEDRVCCQSSQTLTARLKALNFPCELAVYSGLGHDYPRDFGENLPQTLDFILQE